MNVLSHRGQHQAIVALARQVLVLLTPPPVSVEMTAPGVMSLSFPAAARLSYKVQTSPDLVAWDDFTTLTNSADITTTLRTTIPMSPPSGFVRLRY